VTPRTVLYILIGLTTGVGLAIQPIVNSRLRAVLGDPMWAGVVQTLVGLAALVVVAVAVRAPLPAAAGLTSLPWWAWTGGMLGITFVVVTIVLPAKLGTALMFATLILGQMVASVLIDHYGFLGVPVVPLSLTRILGVALLIAGVLFIRR
jgi:transporter family-2 protein